MVPPFKAVSVRERLREAKSAIDLLERQLAEAERYIDIAVRLHAGKCEVRRWANKRGFGPDPRCSCSALRPEPTASEEPARPTPEEFADAADGELSVHDLDASWERLRQRVLKATGHDLGTHTFVVCDACAEPRPKRDIDHHPPSGINLCRPGTGCKAHLPRVESCTHGRDLSKPCPVCPSGTPGAGALPRASEEPSR